MILLMPKLARSAEKHSNGNGLWQNAATWTPAGVPNCGDTVIVNSGDTVTIDNQNNYTGCGSAVVLDVSGVLQFTNGNKLLLPCSSIVSIQFGGLLRKATEGGGTSTLLALCTDTLWRASDGPQSGPLSWGGWILPIELVQFSVNQDFHNYEIDANWSTASETNNDYFTISGSDDGNRWEEITNVQGAGNSNQQIDYHKHLRLNSWIKYVRLSQTDFDGNEIHVAMVALTDMEEDEFAFQNPNSGSFNVQSALGKSSVIEIRNADGRIIQRAKMTNENLWIQIDAAGIYFLTFYTDGGALIESHRVIVQPY
jgi:hypothetical protein